VTQLLKCTARINGECKFGLKQVADGEAEGHEIGRRSTDCSRLDHRTPDHESKRTAAANRELIGIGKMFTVQSVPRKENARRQV
jgi:hypothetical protein